MEERTELTIHRVRTALAALPAAERRPPGRVHRGAAAAAPTALGPGRLQRRLGVALPGPAAAAVSAARAEREAAGDPAADAAAAARVRPAGAARHGHPRHLWRQEKEEGGQRERPRQDHHRFVCGRYLQRI